MNNDMISRKALMDALKARKITEVFPNWGSENDVSHEVKLAVRKYANTIRRAIEDAPAVDAELVRVGTKQVKIKHMCDGDRMSVICSECKQPLADGKEICYSDEAGFFGAMAYFYINKAQSYCPHCGARMEN